MHTQLAKAGFRILLIVISLCFVSFLGSIFLCKVQYLQFHCGFQKKSFLMFILVKCKFVVK